MAIKEKVTIFFLGQFVQDTNALVIYLPSAISRLMRNTTFEVRKTSVETVKFFTL